MPNSSYADTILSYQRKCKDELYINKKVFQLVLFLNEIFGFIFFFLSISTKRYSLSSEIFIQENLIVAVGSNVYFEMDCINCSTPERKGGGKREGGAHVCHYHWIWVHHDITSNTAPTPTPPYDGSVVTRVTTEIQLRYKNSFKLLSIPIP